ncbi:EAL domain-containing protein [Izhakiella capsodis]|uniref:EAL domain-containing protein n=1 Tax=Izhakiella capsodis TaxID=1367852 RepID=A0A1I4V0D0_9GAMM|nr:EAL domain-containing protein [Izhakiella capsodis]SFM94664.1 EAL domain-containing protein [Izhakiella capsodis]
MKIHLEADYISSPLFYPTYRPDGTLLSVTLQLHFHQINANVSIPQEVVLLQLDDEQRLSLLQKKLQIAEKISLFLLERQIRIIITVDEWMAQTIVDSEFLQHKVAGIAALELEVTEQFSGINNGIENVLLKKLYQITSLALANYGAGKANSRAVYDSVFQRITIDKSFIQKQIGKLSFDPFFDAILTNVRPYCRQLVVQGVDTVEMMQVIRQFDIDGITSILFTRVCEEALPTLVTAPTILTANPD